MNSSHKAYVLNKDTRETETDKRSRAKGAFLPVSMVARNSQQGLTNQALNLSV